MQGPAYGYTEPVPQRRVITDLISNIGRDEFPFLMYFGINATGRGGGNKAAQWRLENWPGRTPQWFEDDYYTRVSTLDGASTTADPEEWTVDDAYVFRVGDLIWVEDEVVRVTVVNHATPSITVARGLFGTTAAIHADATSIEKRSQVQKEGADVAQDIHNKPVQKWNHCQIFERECNVSLRAQQMSTYGAQSEMDREIEYKFKECLQDLNGLVYNNKAYASGSADRMSISGGLPFFVNQAAGSGHLDLTDTTPLTVTHVEDMVQSIWYSVKKMPTLMVCGGWAARKITAEFDQKVRMTQDETTGGAVISTIRTHFTDLDILMDPWCPPDTAYILNPDLVGILPAQEFFLKPLSEGGFYTRQGIYGDYTMIVMHANAHGVIENIPLTS